MDLFINDINDEKIIGKFYEKELQRTNQEEFRIEKVIKKKETSYMSNGKAMMIHLIAGLIKRTLAFLNHMSFWRRH